MDYNKVILIGRLTRKPEMRHTPSGMAVTEMCMAVNRRIGKDDKQEATYIDVKAWGKTAEFCERYFDKGAAILVEGRLMQEKWTDKQGQNRSALKVTAETVDFAGSKSNSDNRNGGGNQQGNYRGGGNNYNGGYNAQNSAGNAPRSNESKGPRQSYRQASNRAYNAPQNANSSEHRYSPEDEPQAAAPAPAPNQMQTEMNDDIPF